MAQIKVTNPPAILGKPHYGKYYNWLSGNFFDSNCGYCFSVCSRITIDHYIPVSLDKNKKNDPHNLVGCCDVCQGATHKWDYHHLKIKHRRHKRIPAIHAVHDVRNEDVSLLFQIDFKFGHVVSKPGANKPRADFLRTLFALDLSPALDKRNEERAIVIDIINDVELFLNNKNNPLLQNFADQKLERYLLKISRNEFWLHCMDIKVPQIVQAEILSRALQRASSI